MEQVNLIPRADGIEPASAPTNPLQIGLADSVQGRARYGAALRVLSAFRVAALSDSDLRSAKLQAREFGTGPAVFADLTALLASETPLDALLLTVPLAQRSPALLALAQAALPALAEVPFGLTLDRTDAALAAMQNASAALFPAFPRRFDSLFEETADLIADDAIGELRQARCEWSLPIGETERGDTVGQYDWNVLLQQVACQSADICRVWFGEPLTVSADIEFLSQPSDLPVSRRRNPRVSDTVAVILVTHERGSVTHQITRTRAAFPGERYLLSGANGTLELLARGGTQLSTAAAPTLTRQRPGQRPERLRTGETFAAANVIRVAALLSHFADCLNGLAKPRIAAADGRAAQEIVHAAYLSSFENIKVGLPLRRSVNIEAMLRRNEDPPALTA